MDWQVIAFLLILFVGLKLLFRRRPPVEVGPGYRLRPKLLLAAERSFFGVLKQAVGEERIVFGKVRVADVLTPQRGMSKSQWQSAFNRISAKHFDFVLCDPRTLSIDCAIELNDKSHRSEKRAARDRLLREACESAGLRLIEVDARKGYSVHEIRDVILHQADA